MRGEREMAREKLRACRFLARGAAIVAPAAKPETAMLDGGGRGAIALRQATLASLASDGLVERRGDEIHLSPAGLAHLRRAGSAAGDDAFAAQHREIEVARVATPCGQQSVAINLAESPLANLARRKDRDGRAFLTEPEIRAGERLRSDYERGQIMPRLGANWVASVSSGRRDGGAAEITEAALSARFRVEKAVVAVGPELSGVLIDVCCFLKGLELVEMERGWPVRSAKIVLKSALGCLSRHYEPPRERGRPIALHWGAADFRPSLARPEAY